MKLNFGDFVEFQDWYISNGKSVCCSCDIPLDERWADLKETYDLTDEDLNTDYLTEPCKVIKHSKKVKTGIYLGVAKINTAIEYYFDDKLIIGNSGGIAVDPNDINIKCSKANFIEVAEVRCEGIKKSYFVPLKALKKVGVMNYE